MTPAKALADLARELGDFIALLEEEAGILDSGQADALSPLTQRRELANRSIAGLWRELAVAARLPADTPLTHLRERVAGTAPQAWTRVEELAQRVARMNRQNSLLIDEQLRRAQTAAQVLRGAAKSRVLYGADGLVSDLPSTQRSIDTA